MKKIFFYLLTCAAIFTSVKAENKAPNLLRNGDFEINNGQTTQFNADHLDLSPWKVFGSDGGFLHNDYLGEAGSAWSVKMFDDLATYLVQDFPVSPGGKYKASGFSYNASADQINNKEAGVKFDWYSDLNGEEYISSSHIATITGGGTLDTWVKFSKIVNAPNNAIMGRITIFSQTTGPNPGGAIGIDNLSVVELKR